MCKFRLWTFKGLLLMLRFLSSPKSWSWWSSYGAEWFCETPTFLHSGRVIGQYVWLLRWTLRRCSPWRGWQWIVCTPARLWMGCLWQGRNETPPAPHPRVEPSCRSRASPAARWSQSGSCQTGRSDPALQSSGSGGQAQGRPQEYASSPGYGREEYPGPQRLWPLWACSAVIHHMSPPWL